MTQRSGAHAPQKDLTAGWTQLQPWLAIKAGTDREQSYLNAIRAMYEGYDQISADERDRKYLARMQDLRRQYPEDVNASLFYAIRLVFTAGSGKEGLEKRKEALAILLPIFKQYPNNPGAAHYIIHAADTADLAPVALSAARKYATIAPDAPHALHMPSHIFNRLGYWKESISANQASARVAALSAVVGFSRETASRMLDSTSIRESVPSSARRMKAVRVLLIFPSSLFCECRAAEQAFRFGSRP